MLGIPGNLDQYLNMHYLEKAGLGLSLRSTQLRPAAVAESARQLLQESTSRTAVSMFAESPEAWRSALEQLQAQQQQNQQQQPPKQEKSDGVAGWIKDMFGSN